MNVPLHRLKKAEIVWLATNTCTAHRHSYLTHYNCYLAEIAPRQERVAFFDIETTDLVADFGIMLSWAIKPAGSSEILHSVITKKELDSLDEDKRLARECLVALRDFDKIVTYYGKRFDAPFLRTRALTHGLEFPFYGCLKHTDLYDVVKHRLRLRSNRMEKACKVVLGHSDKTHLDPTIWRKAGRGDSESLAYILDHNKKDLVDLEKLYNKMIHFSRPQDSSV